MPTIEQVMADIAVEQLGILDMPFGQLTENDLHSHLWSSLPDAIEEKLGVQFGSDDIVPGTTLRELARRVREKKRSVA